MAGKQPYHAQKHAAARRGVEWRLSFEQWLKVWTDSGKLNQRGRRSDQFCMSRVGDCGPYAVGNVRIITNRKNHLERDGSAVAESNRRRMNDPAWAKKVRALGRAQAAKINSDPALIQKRHDGIQKYWRAHGW